VEVLKIVQPVVCIGTSWGGLVAGEFALSHPERTRAVVMLNTPVFKSSALWRDNFVSWGARWLKCTNLYAQGVRDLLHARDAEARDRLHERIPQHIQRARGTALAQAVRSVLLERDDLASRLQSIAAPTLFVAGTHDPMYPVDDRAAPPLNCREPLRRVADCPPFFFSVVDAPTETTRAIISFWTNCDARFTSRPQGTRL